MKPKSAAPQKKDKSNLKSIDFSVWENHTNSTLTIGEKDEIERNLKKLVELLLNESSRQDGVKYVLKRID